MKNLLFLIILLTPGFVLASPLKFENKSQHDVHQLYFASVINQEWGADMLDDEDDQEIDAGETFILKDLKKDEYSIKVVDEAYNTCIIKEVDFRKIDSFVLTDRILQNCKVAKAQIGQFAQEIRESEE